MSSINNAAGFIKANMPFSQGNTLTDAEAWDVASYVDSQERPRIRDLMAQSPRRESCITIRRWTCTGKPSTASCSGKIPRRLVGSRKCGVMPVRWS